MLTKNTMVYFIYIIKEDIRICIYMLPIAGHTAGPIGLKFVVDTHGWPRGVKGIENRIYREEFNGKKV